MFDVSQSKSDKSILPIEISSVNIQHRYGLIRDTHMPFIGLSDPFMNLYEFIVSSNLFNRVHDISLTFAMLKILKLPEKMLIGMLP